MNGTSQPKLNLALITLAKVMVTELPEPPCGLSLFLHNITTLCQLAAYCHEPVLQIEIASTYLDLSVEAWAVWGSRILGVLECCPQILRPRRGPHCLSRQRAGAGSSLHASPVGASLSISLSLSLSLSLSVYMYIYIYIYWHVLTNIMPESEHS